MKKILSLFSILTITTASTSAIVSCKTEEQSLRSTLNNIFSFRETGIDYRYLSNWKELMMTNSNILNQYINNFNYSIQLYATKWFLETEKDIKSTFKPLPQLELEGEVYGEQILIDLEFPYSNDLETPFSGQTVVASILGEEEFVQIYNYKYLNDLGYKFTVESSNTDVIKINKEITEDGAIYFYGTELVGSSSIEITATKNGSTTLKRNLAIFNRENTDNAFLQWASYQYIKYDFSNQNIMQFIAACYLVQLYAQFMYNASYNTLPNLTGQLPLLDTRLANMLYCAKEYKMFVNYMEYWASADTPIVGAGFYFSFNFYVRPSINNIGNEEKNLLLSNSLLKINEISVNFVQNAWTKYWGLLGRGI